MNFATNSRIEWRVSLFQSNLRSDTTWFLLGSCVRIVHVLSVANLSTSAAICALGDYAGDRDRLRILETLLIAGLFGVPLQSHAPEKKKKKKQHGPATAAPLQEGRFWKRSETKRRTPLKMSLLLLLLLFLFFEDRTAPRRRLSRRVISGKGLKHKSEFFAYTLQDWRGNA